MKSFISILAGLILLSAFTSFQSPEKDVARVTKIRGKLVFVYCEPLREYDIVEEMSTGMGDFLFGKGTIEDQLNELITRANKRVEKGKMDPFDGIVTKDLQHGSFVKFKE